MKIKISIKDESKLTPEGEEWLKKYSDKLNNSKVFQNFMSDALIFGSSTITHEDIVKDIMENTKNER